MQSAADTELLSEFATRRSEEAFATLVNRHIDLVYSAALRQVQNPQLAEEVTQVVFIILAQKAHTLRKETILSGWLYRTAQFVARGALKKEFRRQRREQEAHMQSLLHETDSDSVWQNISPLLDEAMSHLADKDRNAVILRYFEAKSLNEVGIALGTNEETARKRVSRAVEKLRNFFAKRGTVLPAVTLISLVSANSVSAAPIGLASTVTAAAALKGTIAGASTLTLIKGTLKLMAWTKIKTTVVATAIVVAGAGTVWTAARLVQNRDPAGIPGLIGWWKMDGSNGTEVKDRSRIFTANNNGRLVKGPTPTISGGRQALQFNGAGQYVALSNIFQKSYTQLSIACWIKHPKTSWQNIVERSRWDDPDGIGLMTDYFGESVDFGHYGDNMVKSKANVQDDQWHHVVGTLSKDGSQYIYSIYVDGELDNSIISSVGLTATKKGWAIGARYDGTWTYQGLIDDVRLYDRALKAREVRKLFTLK